MTLLQAMNEHNEHKLDVVDQCEDSSLTLVTHARYK